MMLNQPNHTVFAEYPMKNAEHCLVMYSVVHEGRQGYSVEDESPSTSETLYEGTDAAQALKTYADYRWADLHS